MEIDLDVTSVLIGAAVGAGAVWLLMRTLDAPAQSPHARPQSPYGYARGPSSTASASAGGGGGGGGGAGGAGGAGGYARTGPITVNVR